MFRKMRREKQQLPYDTCQEILMRGTSGVLALQGDNGYPYAIPISYTLVRDEIIFHCAKEGHKIDAIRHCDKASFCVIDQDVVIPEKYTTAYRSVIVFGTIYIVEDDNAKYKAIDMLAEKYRPGFHEERKEEIEKGFPGFSIVKLHIEHMTGKESKYKV